MKSQHQLQWEAECEMRALGILSDLRDGSMQRWEVSADDWRWIRKVKCAIAKEDKERVDLIRQLLPKTISDKQYAKLGPRQLDELADDQ